VGLSEDPDTLITNIGVGKQQLVEIAKALSKQVKLLILDEPTASLSEKDSEALLNLLLEFKSQGISCILISHKLNEVFAIADRITVLRDGASVFTSLAAGTTQQEVIRHMVGREIHDLFPRRSGQPGDVILRVEGLSVVNDAGKVVLEGIDLEVRAGEVVGIGGLMGAGRTELLMHLFGAQGRRSAGRVWLDGREVPPAAGPARVLRAGMALVTEDRRRLGLVLEHDVGFNLSLSSLRDFCRAGLLSLPLEARANQVQFESLRIKAPGLQAVAGKLSGGNQQKIVLGKVLMTQPKIILLDEPTRGIDVGAKLEIYEIINRLTSEGKAVLLVSSELPELLGMSDRILMLRQGRITGEFTRSEATQEKLLAAALDG
jgi:D-xylose transport system ATP-binding protein